MPVLSQHRRPTAKEVAVGQGDTQEGSSRLCSFILPIGSKESLDWIGAECSDKGTCGHARASPAVRLESKLLRKLGWELGRERQEMFWLVERP